MTVEIATRTSCLVDVIMTNST